MPNIIEASETISLLTTHCPMALATRPLDLINSTLMKIVSPGTTGLRELHLVGVHEITDAARLGFARRRSMLATCAIASSCRTPGMTG